MNRPTLALIACVAFSASAFAQEMSAPSFAVGDRWSYRETDLLTKIESGRLTETVTAVNSAEYWIDARRKARTWWRGDNVKHWHREQFLYADDAPDQRGKSIASSDAGCAYPWPLKVGTKFECTEVIVWPNGWKIRYDLKFKAEAAETVDTPAGRFDTLRLVADGFANNETTGHAAARHQRTIWLAPAVKREVKHEIRSWLQRGDPFRVEGRELVEFKAGGGG